MNNFFNTDNFVYSFLNTLANLILTNILCILCCIPVITAGASITAMYSVTLRIVSDRDISILKAFFTSFRQNFKQATKIWAVLFVLFLLIYFDINLITGSLTGSFITSALQIIIGLFSVFLLLTVLYLFPMLAKFDNNTKQLFINSFITSIRHLPSTLLIILMSSLPYVLMMLSLKYGLFINGFFGFALSAYANSFLFNRIFEGYIPVS